MESPGSFLFFGNEKSTPYEDLDDVWLDVDFMDVEAKPRSWSCWSTFRRWVLVSPVLSENSTSLLVSASLIFLGVSAITWVCYLCVPKPGFGDPLPQTVTSVWHPEIQVDAATFVGASYGSVDGFLGIPFAKPPWVSILPPKCPAL